jgi:hypothetical protein
LDVNELEWEELMGLTTRLKPNEESTDDIKDISGEY